jgi:hypothetical protein
MIHSELGRDRPNLTVRAIMREILAKRSALNREVGNLIHITILLDDPIHGMCLIRQRSTRLALIRLFSLALRMSGWKA